MATPIQPGSHEAAKRFGLMLRRWRVANSWTQYTAENWSHEAGKAEFHCGNISELENAKVRYPRCPVFLGLAALNAHVAAQDFSGVHTRTLLDQLKGSRPITHDDGTPWGAADFWSCHTGLLCSPDWLSTPDRNPPPAISGGEAEQLSDAWSAQVRATVRLHGGGRGLFSRALTFAPAGQRDRWECALIGHTPYSPEELLELWDWEAGKHGPQVWLDRWLLETFPTRQPAA